MTIASVDLIAKNISTTAFFTIRNYILLQQVQQIKVYSNPVAILKVRKKEFMKINGYGDWIRTSNVAAVLCVI